MKEKCVVALAGNPNVGKSTLFNALTGGKQHTGNWTGKTVEMAKGYCETEKYILEILDLPGTYSLNARSCEEKVARDYIEGSEYDGVVVVCDASCLERNLILVLQIMNITEKVIVCVNLLDEAEKRGISVDIKKLSELLGVAVVGTVAKKRQSTETLKNAIDILNTEKRKVGNRYRVKPETTSKSGTIMERIETKAIANAAEDIARQVMTGANNAYSVKEQKADKILTGKATAYPIMLGLLALILWITLIGANYPSRILSEALFEFQEILTRLFLYINAPTWLHGILVLGIYRVVAWVVSVMLPPMAIFFPMFTLLEDSGYLPRIAYNLDKPFNKCRTCGKQALTMCMGFGCNAVGVTGCRIIDSPRERLLAILTNSFVPCNGRFPAMLAIMTIFFAGTATKNSGILSALLLTVAIILGIMMTFLMTAILSKTLLRGVTSSFILELPPYRTPQIGKVIVRSVLDRTLFVLARAITAAAPMGAIIWLAANITVGDVSILYHCADFLSPFAKLIGLDGVILIAFILGLPANEIVIPIITMAYTAAGTVTELGTESIGKILTENGWSWKTAVCFIIFSLFHWPCATTLMTVKKETGSGKWTALSAALPTAAGIICCAMFTAICSLLGI